LWNSQEGPLKNSFWEKQTRKSQILVIYNTPNHATNQPRQDLASTDILLALGAVTAKVGIVRVFAGSAVGAKQVSVRVLELPKAIGVAVARLGVFAVLARPAQPQMTRVPAIAGGSTSPIRVLRFEAATAVEAMGTSALDSRNLAVVAEPAVGTFLREEEK
jgi:hypothetical protein